MILPPHSEMFEEARENISHSPALFVLDDDIAFTGKIEFSEEGYKAHIGAENQVHSHAKCALSRMFFLQLSFCSSRLKPEFRTSSLAPGFAYVFGLVCIEASDLETLISFQTVLFCTSVSHTATHLHVTRVPPEVPHYVSAV